MTITKAMRLSLLALLLGFTASGCAALGKLIDKSNEKTGTFKLFSIRVPNTESACIDSAYQLYLDCGKQGEEDTYRCNGMISNALKQCPGASPRIITESGKLKDVVEKNCVAELASGLEVYCWTIGLEEDDSFEDASAMSGVTRVP